MKLLKLFFYTISVFFVVILVFTIILAVSPPPFDLNSKKLKVMNAQSEVNYWETLLYEDSPKHEDMILLIEPEPIDSTLIKLHMEELEKAKGKLKAAQALKEKDPSMLERILDWIF